MVINPNFLSYLNQPISSVSAEPLADPTAN